MTTVNDTLTAVGGIRVGHARLPGTHCGCTVVIGERAMAAGVDVRGSAPGTYGADTLHPLNLVDRVDGLFFTGGSAYGLDVARGLRSHLQELGCGFDTGYGRIPIVCGAVIFDLGLNPDGPFPNAELARRACRQASSEPLAEGCEGAGAGATVGKLFGLGQAMKSGVGSACIHACGGLKVAALMVVNAFGDVVDSRTGRIVAGCRKGPTAMELLDADAAIEKLHALSGFPAGQNTVVGMVATNAQLHKVQLTKIAQMAHDGMARAVRPAHTMYDGDTVFAVSCGDLEGIETSVVGALAARVTARAIVRAVEAAVGWQGLPAASDLH